MESTGRGGKEERGRKCIDLISSQVDFFCGGVCLLATLHRFLPQRRKIRTLMFK